MLPAAAAAAALCAATVPPGTATVGADNCTFVAGWDYINNASGSAAPAASPQDCCVQCKADAQCVVGVYFQAYCYLKRSADGASPRVGAVACVTPRAPAPPPAPPLPAPTPGASDVQRAAFAQAKAEAERASPAVTPELLALLDSAAFRKFLTPLVPADLATLPAAELLARLEEALDIAEVVHNWDAAPGGVHGSIGLELASQLPYYPNSWQLAALNVTPPTQAPRPGNMQDAAEVSIFHLPELPADYSFASASDRVVYTALNTYKVDGGNPHFGTVSAVWSNKFVRDATVIAAVDTGIYEMTCNDSYHSSHHPKGSANCTGWAPRGATPLASVGVPGSLRHLVLANAYFYNYTAVHGPTPAGTDYAALNVARLVARQLQRWATAPQLLPNEAGTQYFEANPLTALTYPGAVKFLIASYHDLFGTPVGARVREWCVQRGWPLLWGGTAALNRTDPAPPHPYPAKTRLLDPVVLAALPAGRNLSVGRAAAAFDSAWAAGAGATPLPTLVAETGAELSVEPLFPGACADPECVGVRVGDSTCVCAPR